MLHKIAIIQPNGFTYYMHTSVSDNVLNYNGQDLTYVISALG